MFDPRLIDVAIGIILLFLLVSLLVTIVQEAIASLFKLRAANLRAAIVNLIGAARAASFYRHPLITSLYRSKPGETDAPVRRLPSYIPDRTFVLVLLDILRDEGAQRRAPGLTVEPGAHLLEGARAIVGTLAGEDQDHQRLHKVLSLLLSNLPAEVTAEGVGAALERWFNDAMDRAAGWYKRQAQLLSVLVGFALAGLTNADAVHVARRLWTDASLRATATAAAAVYQRDHAVPGVAAAPAATPSDALAVRLDKNLTDLEASTLPVGWMRNGPQDCVAQFCSDRTLPPGSLFNIIVLMLAGWSITALAASLGAPFWFDLLSKALQIRSSGTRVPTDSEPANKR